MSGNNRDKVLFLLLAGSAWFGVANIFAKSDQAGGDNGKSNVQSHAKDTRKVNLKTFEQPNVATGTTNASLHRVAIEGVVTTLEQVSQESDKPAGNATQGRGNGKNNDLTTTTSTGSVIDSTKTAKVKAVVKAVVTEAEVTGTETTDAIEAVETRSKVKTLLLGTDYKNLGQLRSSLVHTRNDIRKLTQALASAQTPEEKAAIDASLAALMLERERIKTVITTNETGFSLFGWVSRFLMNYEATPIDTKAEDDLTQEVVNAIDESSTDTDSVADTDTDTATTPTTDTTTPAATVTTP